MGRGAAAAAATLGAAGVGAAAGLPPRHAPTSADVIVIGAGVAGMSAATALVRANRSVLVLEASNRTGGRMKAYHFGDPSVARVVLENGPNWISGVNYPPPSSPGPGMNPLYGFALEVGLSTIRDVADSPGGHTGDSVVVTASGARADADGGRRAAAAAAWECANRSAVAAYHSGRDEPLADALARCGWRPAGVVDDAIDWMLTVDPQGPGMSLRGALPVHTYMWWGAEDYMVIDQHPRGFARLIDHFSADALPPGDPRVVFDSTVTRVSYGECGASPSGGDAVVATADGRRFSSRHVISTLPLGVVRRGHGALFDPPLGAGQAAALAAASITMTNYTKAVLQWREPFWPASMRMLLAAGRGGVKGDTPLWRNMNAYVNGSNALFVDIFEPQSSRFEAMSDAAAQAELLSRLRELFPEAAIGAPTAFHITRHGTDPLSWGAYSINNTHDEVYRQMVAPLRDSCGGERVLWAGEHACDMLNGYAHSAYESGLRAAAQALHAAGHGPAPSSICDRDRP